MISENVQARIRAMTADFVSQLPRKLEDLRESIQAARCEDPRRDDLEAVRTGFHKLAGTAATFGLVDVSEKAGRADSILIDRCERGIPPTDEQWQEIVQVFEDIRDEAERSLEEMGLADTIGREVEAVRGREQASQEILYFGDPDTEYGVDLRAQLEIFGFTLSPVRSMEAVEESIHGDIRNILILDYDRLESAPDTGRTLAGLKRRSEAPLHILTIAENDCFKNRLASVRAGGDAFFILPVDISRLVDRLDEFSRKNDSPPYHILVIDDDPDQIAYYSLILQQAGMITSVALNPEQVFNVLIEARPELILMDLYMPGCDGPELAAVIRQQESFVSIPIIFMSVERDVGKQLEAIRRGGDDFITKPIKPEYLVSAIVSKAERTRSMRYFMERDSLTGLLNHSNLKEQLRREILRAHRTQQPVTFAMIDADHFKRVNDTYGHLAGDRVLMSLSRLLTERLRRTDIIGRYGGEEFGVILINTPAAVAVGIMDQIRESFSKIRHHHQNEEFYVTFSCGIAGYPTISDPEAVSVAADEALYMAKTNGRNTTMMIEAPSTPAKEPVGS
jgi:diguanylate cyclase (GGDEF)-like protein